MSRFAYVDKNGKNEYSVAGVLSVDRGGLTVTVGADYGDGDGDTYTMFVPNHREAIKQVINDLIAVYEASEGVEKGYDGFSFNFALAYETGNMFLYGDDEPGVVKEY